MLFNLNLFIYILYICTVTIELVPTSCLENCGGPEKGRLFKTNLDGCEFNRRNRTECGPGVSKRTRRPWR